LTWVAQAQEATIGFDPGSTKIEFTVGATLHSVHGTFALKSGTIHFNPSTGKASGLIAVDVKSGQTGIDRRDRKMHSQVLESERYPDATFIPVHFSGTVASQGESTIQLDGNFRIHGTDHLVTWPVTVEISGDSLTAKIHTTIPYVNWGMKNPSTFVLHVDDKVDLDISASGSFSQSRTPVDVH
jgi:polyisoprenoid-binding protein YceI